MTASEIYTWLSIVSLFVGTIIYIFMSKLDERKEGIQQSLDIKHLSEDMGELKKDIKEVKDKCEKFLLLEERLNNYIKFNA